MLRADSGAGWNTDKDKHLVEKLVACVDEGAAFELEAPWGDLVADVSAVEVGDTFTGFLFCFSLFGKCSFSFKLHDFPGDETLADSDQASSKELQHGLS